MLVIWALKFKILNLFLPLIIYPSPNIQSCNAFYYYEFPCV